MLITNCSRSITLIIRILQVARVDLCKNSGGFLRVFYGLFGIGIGGKLAFMCQIDHIYI